MAKQLRLLLDTNVIIPLQDSLQVLSENLANLHRLAVLGGHQILYHPATIADFERDSNAARRGKNLRHIKRYPALENPAPCPWNSSDLGPNDACDNEILYALHCDAVHALITEDRGLLAKARKRGLGVMSRDVVESVEGYAANRRVVSVVVVEVEPAGQRQASFGL